VSEAQIIGKPFVDTELHEKARTALARRAPGKSCACGGAERGSQACPSGRRTKASMAGRHPQLPEQTSKSHVTSCLRRCAGRG
jgi:hypothetical protein